MRYPQITMAESCTGKPLPHFKCSMCNKDYNCEKSLFKHLYKHEHPKQFSCLECNKTFPTKTRLKIHDRIHSGDRPFKCLSCHVYFASRFQLKLHQRRHTGEKPYACSFCPKEFSSSSGLRQHVKTHTKDSPFTCDHCGKSFKQKEKLRQHERIHTGLRPFMCDQCPKSFRIKNALVRHLRIHSGDTYKCKLCPKGFGELYALKKHHRKKHETIQFTGASERLIHEDKTNCRNQDKNSSLVTKVKRTNTKKNKSKAHSHEQRKRRVNASNLTSANCLAPAKSHLNKDVVEKLFLEIGQRDSSAVIDENGWHRIPISAASDLLSRNTGAIKKLNEENSKKTSSIEKKDILNGKLCGRENAELDSNEAANSSAELELVTAGGAINSNGSESLSTGLPQMASKDVSQRNYENTSVPSVCQQSDQSSVTGRKTRRITHPSTIDYFPVADHISHPVYVQADERFQFLNNSAHEPAPSSCMQNPPHKFLACDLQTTEINQDTFIGNVTAPKKCLSKPDYNHRHFQRPDRNEQPGDRGVYQLHRTSDRISLETDHCPIATLHHRPEPVQQNYRHDEDQYFSVEPHYSNSLLPETVHEIDLDCSWNDHHPNIQELLPFNKTYSVATHYNQASSCALDSSLASFRAPLRPTISPTSSSSCGHDPLPILQNSSFSVMPFQHSSYEAKPSQLPLPREHLKQSNQTVDQIETLQSNQRFQNQPCLHQKESLLSNQPFQNQPCLQEKESLLSNQPFQNQPCLQEKESLLSNQPFQNQPEKLIQPSLQQHLSAKQNQPSLDQNKSTKSNQPEQLICNLNFSSRSDSPSYHHVPSANSIHDPHQNVVMFPRSESSVVHHKPVPAASNDNKIDVHATDPWPVYRQTQHRHLLFPDQGSFPCDVTNDPVRAISCRVNKESCRNNRHFKTLDLPIRASLRSHQNCIVAEKSCSFHQRDPSLNLPKELLERSGLENSSSLRQISHHLSATDLPKGLLDCNVLENLSIQLKDLARGATSKNLPHEQVKKFPEVGLHMSSRLLNEGSAGILLQNPHNRQQSCSRGTLDLAIEASVEGVQEGVQGCLPHENPSTRQLRNKYFNSELLKGASNGMGLPKVAPDCMGLPKVAPDCMGLPKVAPDCMGLPKVAPDCMGLRKVASDCMGLPKVAPDCMGLPKVAPDLMDLPQEASDCMGLPQEASDCMDLPQEASDCMGLQKRASNHMDQENSKNEPEISRYMKLDLASCMKHGPACIIQENSCNVQQADHHMDLVQKYSCSGQRVDKRESHNSRETNHNLGYEPHKLNSKTVSLSNIAKEDPDKRKDDNKFLDDNDLNVNSDEDDNEDDFEINCKKSNEIQPFMNKKTNEHVEKALVRLNLDFGQDEREKIIISGKKQSEETRPLISKCSTFPQKVNRASNGVTQNMDRASESINFSGTIKRNKPSEDAPESYISDGKQHQVNETSKQKSSCLKKLTNNSFSKTSVCCKRHNCSENVQGRKLRKRTRKCSNEVKKSDFCFVDSERNLINNDQENLGSSLCSTVDEKEKVDLFSRNSNINQEKKIEDINLKRKENDQEINLWKQKSDQETNIKNQVLKKKIDDLLHKCQTCGKKFPNNSRLQRHAKTHAPEKPYACTLCPQAFTGKRYLDNHINRHNKQPQIFACNDCGKTFPRRYQLKIHYRTHSGEKPYKCKHCSSHFATSFQVQLHERIHFDDLPFRCNFCGKCFRSKTNLSLHVKRHMNNKPYLCATCGVTFYEASKLKAHVRVHTGVEPFMCDQCPKTFKVKHLLVRHLRWHSGDTFKCEHCSKPFDEKWALKVHTQKHHS